MDRVVECIVYTVVVIDPTSKKRKKRIYLNKVNYPKNRVDTTVYKKLSENDIEN